MAIDLKAVRERYGLKEKKQIAIFVVILVLILVGVVSGVFELIEAQSAGDYIAGIYSAVMSVLLLAFTLFGYKMRILSFQIFVGFLAALYAVLAVCAFIGGHIVLGVDNIAIVGLLVGFALSIKRKDAMPRIFIFTALGVQFPNTVQQLMYSYSNGVFYFDYAIYCFQFIAILVIFILIFYSRIARSYTNTNELKEAPKEESK